MNYNYYLGYRKEGKYYPLGSYNSFGTLCPVLKRTENYASNLYSRFSKMKEDAISYDLKKEFEVQEIRYLPIDELPLGSYIKSGYFLIDEVKKFEEEKDEFFEFSEYLLPRFYAAKLQNEIMFGFKNTENLKKRSVSDYMFYTYPDYRSEEFEARVIYTAVDSVCGSIGKEDLIVFVIED